MSNLGMFGVEEFTAIINPPEAAILAVGGIKQKVVSVNGTIDVKPLMKVTLCSDHRIVDGVIAAQFLGYLKRYFEEDIA
jgi:pyruvate dehydrogenase E2 component (dihydrolipoamide acetyltransferase)